MFDLIFQLSSISSVHYYMFPVFDVQALVTLFVLASKDGWVDIMYHGIDAVEVDHQVSIGHSHAVSPPPPPIRGYLCSSL